MKFPSCPTSIQCDCRENPLTNFSSEEPDSVEFGPIIWPIPPVKCLGSECEPKPHPCYSNCPPPPPCRRNCPPPRCVGNCTDGPGPGPGPDPTVQFCARGACQIECPTGSGNYQTYNSPTLFCGTNQTAVIRAANSNACAEGHRRVIPLGNTDQHYTAHCDPPESGPPNSASVAAGSITRCLLNPTEDEIRAAQADLDAQALAQATALAQANLHCGTCNDFIHAFASCPGDPGKVASLTYQHGELLCLPYGTPQATVDNLASQMMYNNLQAALAAMGCTCTSNFTAGVFHSACLVTVRVTFADDGSPIFPGGLPAGLIGVDSTHPLDVPVFYQLFWGNPFPSGRGYVITPWTYTAPSMTVAYP